QSLVSIHRIWVVVFEQPQLDRAALHPLARALDPNPEPDGDVRADAEAQEIGERRRLVDRWRPAEPDDHFRAADGEALPGPDGERPPLPPPRVNLQPHRGIGLHLRARGDPLLVAVASELAPHDTVSIERSHGLEDLHLLIADRLAVRTGGG